MVFGVAIMLSPSWLVVVLAFTLLYVGVFWEEIYEGVVERLKKVVNRSV